jgi:multidrug efflux system membrane fusion protein
MDHRPSTPAAAGTRPASRRPWRWIGLVVLLLLVALAWGVWRHRQSAAVVAPGATEQPAGGAPGMGGGPGGFGGPGGPGGGGGGRRFGGLNRVQPVSVVAVRRQDVRVMVSAIGTIAAANTATVHAKVDGELKALNFTEGQPVRAGQVIAQIDPRPFEVALAQAQGQLERDQAQLQNALIDLQRYKDLIAQDAVPKQQVDTQEALVRQLRGTVATDQAQVDSARLNLSYTRVVAPISGVAGLRQVDLGNIVHASDATGILTIAQTQPVNVVFAVPDVNLPKVMAGMKPGQTLAVEAWDREQKTLLAQGQVAAVDNAIDPTTGTVKLKARFPNADGHLFPNQSVNVRLRLDTLKDVLAAPSAAVLRGAQGSYVYLVNADRTVSMRPVKPGAADGDWVALQGDLQPGDQVVTDGTDRLRDGAQVEVIAPAETLKRLDAQAASGRSGRRPGGAASGPGAWAGGTSGAGGAGGAPWPGAGASGAHRPAAATAEGATAAGSGAGPAAASASAAGGERPPWMDRLPPEVAEKVMKMSPEERRAWFQQRRAERAQQNAAP